jgi:hypothetical protein
MQGDCPLHGTPAFRAGAVLPVVLRYADAQVAAERERIAAEIEVVLVPEKRRQAYHYVTATKRAARIARAQP